MSTRVSRSTAAWPLAWIYGLLIVYASLYPFENWRVQGIAPWAFLWAPLPRYWTGFDVLSNVLGYAPLGFLLALGLRRTHPQAAAILLAAGASLLLSLLMESLQMFLPSRVPSNVDAALNTVGAWAGAVLAHLLDRLGVMARWSRFRDRWFSSDAGGMLALLALWPVALLFPVAVPFGLGQVLERLEDAAAHLVQDTPWIDWLPLREVELQPLLPLSQVLCVALGMLLPCLLVCGVVRHWRQRLALVATLLALGLLASALSAALTYGPAHVWGWLHGEVRTGVMLALLASVGLLVLPARVCWVLALAALVWQLSLLNNASTDAYFEQTLQTWEQGRFIRFHGLIQWLGWLWPYAVLVYLIRRLSDGARL